ncbi:MULTISPECIES: Cys-tRNA(Pro) deacylase [Leptotrichia]|jgi:ybaK/ebsC protein|uniref:Cys-tRNA(Pro)/Cys-tRNA(Cys) deacylase n=1 Tax=Leptotrichia wadei (strain F0279) TaxID=888055 RepID=U2R8P0_LEPWF|nr:MULTISPECIES: Cys-tRNA(Pro) deacylase [Leptotrichia]ERK49953.1 YbaK/EbsC protein [Leptotrichia wadei F0279]NWO27092.1 Cys-tRNA(Pro) deacylase [Leptotrichia sp. oral taxon 417]
MKHKKDKIAKTNALRQLDKQKIPYIIHTYEWSEDKSGGLGVAEKFPELAERVFKTIVLKGKSKNLYVCVIHGAAHLDLKKVAKACGEKNIDLLPLSELEKETGYIRGGCSPVGMKKLYRTFFDKEVEKFEKIMVSAGRRGLQMEVETEKLVGIVNGTIVDLLMEEIK